jgi:hypothetical protein
MMNIPQQKLLDLQAAESPELTPLLLLGLPAPALKRFQATLPWLLDSQSAGNALHQLLLNL